MNIRDKENEIKRQVMKIELKINSANGTLGILIEVQNFKGTLNYV